MKKNLNTDPFCKSWTLLLLFHNHHMLWFNFVLGSNFIFLCFKLIIVHYNTQKQKKIKFEPRIKLNHNIHWPFWCRQLVQRQYNFHSKKCRHYERGLHDMLLLHFSNIKVSYLKLTMHRKISQTSPFSWFCDCL